MERLSGGGGANAIDIICPFYDPLLPYSLALFPHLKRRVKLTIVRASVRFAARETKAIDRSAGKAGGYLMRRIKVSVVQLSNEQFK